MEILSLKINRCDKCGNYQGFADERYNSRVPILCLCDHTSWIKTHDRLPSPSLVCPDAIRLFWIPTTSHKENNKWWHTPSFGGPGLYNRAVLDPAKYRSVDQWRAALEKHNYEIPFDLCFTMQRIMRLRNLSFVKAYRLLESNDVLEVQYGSIKYDEEKGEQLLLELMGKNYPTEDEEILCSFYSIVIPRKILDKQYDGGTNEFITQHKYASYNDDIVTYCAMGASDLSEVLSDLKKNNFLINKDFVYFDASAWMVLGMPVGKKYKFEVNWLCGHFVLNGVIVKYQKS